MGLNVQDISAHLRTVADKAADRAAARHPGTPKGYGVLDVRLPVKLWRILEAATTGPQVPWLPLRDGDAIEIITLRGTLRCLPAPDRSR